MGRSDLYMMVYDLLIADAEVFGKLVVLGQGRQIPIFIGGIYPFEDGVVIAHALNQLLDELLMLDQIDAPQMEDSRPVPVDQVMDLLGQPIVIGNIDDQIGKYLYGLILVQERLYFPDPRGTVPKDHGNPYDGRTRHGLPHDQI